MPNPDGRPLKYETPEELQKVIDDFFQKCIEDDEPQTIYGLCNAIDMTRQSLCNYAAKDEFFDTLRRARQRCAEYTEKQLYKGKAPTGAIFSLKCNYGWEDKSESKGMVINILDKTASINTQDNDNTN